MRRPKHKVVTGPGVKATPKADNFHDTLPLELAGRADGPGVSSKTWRLRSIVSLASPSIFR